MKGYKLFFNIFFVFFICINLNASSGKITLAVLDFDNNSIFDRDDYEPLKAGLAEMMISELSCIESIKIVERQKLHMIFNEFKMSQSGLTQENSIKAGKMLGADYLVFGSFIVAHGAEIRVDTRIVDVETGLTVKAEEVTGKIKKILDLINKLGRKILKGIDAEITLNENEKFSKSQKLKMDAVILFSKGVTCLDAGKIIEAEKCFKKALEIEPKFVQAEKQLKNLHKK